MGDVVEFKRPSKPRTPSKFDELFGFADLPDEDYEQIQKTLQVIFAMSEDEESVNVIPFPTRRDLAEDAAVELVRMIADRHVAAGLRPTHALKRINPKGEPFIGRCILCGRSGFTAEDAHKDCTYGRPENSPENPVGRRA